MQIGGKICELRFRQGTIKKIWAEINCNSITEVIEYSKGLTDVLEFANFAAICAFYGGEGSPDWFKSIEELEDSVESLEQISPAVEAFTAAWQAYFGIKPVEPNAPAVEVDDEKKLI